MKINILIYSLFFLSISELIQAQEKLVPMNPKGDPVLVEKSKAILESEFGVDAKVTITSVEPFEEPAWEALFPNSSPTIVHAVIAHPDSGHAAGITFIVSTSGTKYAVSRSMEPSGFLKALKSHNKRVENTQDAEAIARAFAELCGLILNDKIETQKSGNGYTVSLSTQSGKSDASKEMRIDLELLVDGESRLVSEARAKSWVPAESDKKE